MNQTEASQVKQPFYTKLAMILLSIYLIGYLAIQGKELLSPFIIAMLFAIMLLPAANFFEKKLRFSRTLSTFTSIFMLLGVILFLLYLLGSQLSTVADDWPVFKEQLMHTLDTTRTWLSHNMHIDSKKQITYIQDATSKIISSSTVILGTTVISASSLLLFLVFILIYCFFLLFYRRHIVHFLVYVFREDNKAIVYDILEQVQYVIRSYLLGLMLEMLLVSVACCMTFWILGIKYAILLGLIVGVFNIIPYIGIFSALLLSTIITFASGATLSTVGLVAVSVIIIHLIDSNFLLPVIVGSKVRINALITIAGVIIGEMMWGISGMFLSIPVVAILKIIFDRVDGLRPWGMLLGEETRMKKKKTKQPKITSS
ncbi:MAG: AI-2E family transporter [Agriterribacter sp.]